MIPTWDIVLLAFGGVSILYGLMLRERVVVTLLGAYAAMIVADRWGEALYRVITEEGSQVFNQQILQGSLSVFTVQVVLFAVVMLVVALRGGILIHPDSMGIGSDVTYCPDVLRSADCCLDRFGGVGICPGRSSANNI